MNDRLRVGIAGCGFIGRRREQALDGDDDLEAARYAWTVIEDAYPRSAP